MSKSTVKPADRAAVLERARDLKMARSLHAYVRGATERFYAWLEESRAAADVPAGPAVWICGDCHVGNLGPVAGPDGAVETRIRDLDQTVIGNPAHDLIRLGLSLATAARAADLPGVATALMVEAMVDGYDAALHDIEGDEAEAASPPAAVRLAQRQALGRGWRKLARERLGDLRLTLPIGKRFWPLAHGERAALEEALQSPQVRERVLGLDPGRGGVEVLDAAYWLKGCSSLGKLRYAASLKLDVGVPTPGADGVPEMGGGWVLVDIKEAPVSAAPSSDPGAMPADPAERVVTGARALTPELGERMAPARLLDRPVVVRELKPQDLKLDLSQFRHQEAPQAARHLAWIVGRSHGAQMDAHTRRRWRAELARQHDGGLEAPSWLWRSVVDLAANHEAGYLEHCRRYALSAA